MPHRAARAIILACLCALAPLLAACSPLDALRPAHGNRLDDTRQVLHPLLVGEASGDFDTLDPALIRFNADYDVAQSIFPPLVTLDASLDVIPWAAASLPDVSADGLTYTFYLHPNMKWSDGSPIDAATYAYAINRSLDRCTGSGVWSYLDLIKGAAAFHRITCPQGDTDQPESINLTDGPDPSVVVSDPLTLRLTLERPAAYFLAEFTYPTSYAVPRRLIERYGAQWTDHLADGTGFGGNLFKVMRWVHWDHLSLARNDAFWGTKPALRAIEWTLYSTPTTLWDDYKSGTGDVGAPTPGDIADAMGMPGYREIPALTVRYLHLNWARPPFDDARVRQAFDLAFDRNALCGRVPDGACLPTCHMLIRGLPGYNAGLKDPAGRTGDAALTADLPDARRLASAYRDERCGGDYANCPPVRLIIAGGSVAETALGQFIVSQWQAAFPGWKIAFGRPGPAPPGGGNPYYQISSTGWGADYPDPQDFLSLLVRTGADYNLGFVSIPEADALLDRADATPDRATRLGLYQQAEQLYVDQVAWIPWGQDELAYAVRPAVAGWAYDAAGQVPLPAWQSAYLHD